MTTDAINLGGVSLPDTINKDVFYGMRVDPATGHFSIDVIANGQGVVRLPTDQLAQSGDYRQWIWTKNQLSFAINASGHLEMTVV